MQEHALAHWTTWDWFLALWTATIALALFALEILIFVSYSPSPFTPSKVALALIVLIVAPPIWYAGILVAGVLALVVSWAIGTMRHAR